MPEDEGKAQGYTQSALCTEFSLDDDIEANDNTNHLGGRREECGDDDAEDDVDDEDNKHLGGHREECGDTKRHSSRDRVLVEPETHLSLEMSNCRIFDKHVHEQGSHENDFSNTGTGAEKLQNF